MEPLKPIVRDALKEAHPGLTDATIDLAEELLAQRFLIDPEAEPQRIRDLDLQRAELLRSSMPKFDQIVQRFQEQEELGERRRRRAS